MGVPDHGPAVTRAQWEHTVVAEGSEVLMAWDKSLI